MKWIDLTRNPKSITHLYNVVPELKQVEVSQISLNPDGPMLKINIDLPIYADHVPQRWGTHPNTVCAEIDFWCIDNLIINGFTRMPILNFQFERENEYIAVVASGEKCSINFTCNDIFIQRVTGYHNENRERT